MARLKDRDWNMRGSEEEGPKGIDCITINLLMDIRDELKRINGRLDCGETLRIPRYLRRIASNTTKRKRAK